MPKKHNTYDSGYKKLFSSPEMVRQLLVYFISDDWVREIDYSSLERIDKSFITDEFINRKSDLIYRAKFRQKDIYIFLLLEFQSTVDRFMALRMVRYIAELYEYLVKNYRLKTLPAVFPVMLYNGEKRWTAPVQLGNLIERTIPAQYIPCFVYYKIAENEFSREFLKEMNNSVAALFYTENCSEDTLRQEIDVIAGLIRRERPEEVKLFVHWFRYMFSDRPELVDEIKEVEEVKTMLRTSIERYGKKIAQESKLEGIQEGIQKGMQKGMQKGIDKGVQKGIKQKALETAKALLKKKMPVNEIAEITGITVNEIKKLN